MKHSSPKQTSPKIAPVLWENGFGMAEVVPGSFRRTADALWVIKYKRAKKHRGNKCPWGVEEGEVDLDTRTVVRVVKRKLFKTEGDAKAAHAKWEPEFMARKSKELDAMGTKLPRRLLADDKDLQNARLKVLREQYPDTFRAMDGLRVLTNVTPEKKAASVEAVYRAFMVDMVRLHKRFGALLDIKLILEIAKAYKTKTPYDPVDVEIASHWFSKGYDKMSLAQYTRAINAATGANLKPEAMERRRYSKHGLMTKKRPGPPAKA